jgi:endonuclease/exonuclease/phosphatase (EEP) superfamily protein YafD
MSELLRKRVDFFGLLMAAGSIICAVTLFGFAGRLWWVFDLFSHFRVQYFLSTSLILILLLIGKRFRASAVFGLIAAINFACILPYYLSPNPATSKTPVLRAVSINVNTANEQFDAVKDFILEHNPDFILLMEVNADWVKALEEMRPVYPYQKSEPREDNFGIALYSKLSFTRCDVAYLGRAGVPSIVGEFDVEGQKLTLVGTHPLPPISDVYSHFRNDQIEAVSVYLASVPGPKILLGDLNMSPWSYYFGRLLSRARLVDSSIGRGIEPTWPTHQIWMRIPIDFCLVSEEISIEAKKVGEDIGSDHFPLIVDFSLARR